MNAAISDAQARDVAVRQLYGRSPREIVQDLRSCARILERELGNWEAETPSARALMTAETTVDGLRRLLGQLRLALNH